MKFRTLLPVSLALILSLAFSWCVLGNEGIGFGNGEKPDRAPQRGETLIRTACQIPAKWFEDKRQLKGAPKSRIYHLLPHRHQKIADFPPAYLHGFKTPPRDFSVYIGEAYFVDHCLNHHPDVEDGVYRSLQDILDKPEEVIVDSDGEVLLFVKKIAGQRYVLVLRYYGNNRGQIVYKTLYPTDRRVKPWLPRVKPRRFPSAGRSAGSF